MSSVSTKPYLIRAIYEWCVDEGFTPYVAAVVDGETRVPPGASRDGQVVLNIGPDATNQLDMGNDLISFQARFGGVAHSISIPVDNVVAVYARENGHGMAFEIGKPEATDGVATEADSPIAGQAEPTGEAAPDAAKAAELPPNPDKPTGGGRSHLKVIK